MAYQLYEYIQDDITGLTPDEVAHLFQARGIAGWELVSVSAKGGLFSQHSTAYFKRQLQLG